MQPISEASPLSVGFALLHRFALLPFAAFIDCLRLAANEGDRSRQVCCHWTFMTSVGEEAVSSCGAAISRCESFQNPDEFDYIVVIGGVQDERDRTDSTALAYLREAANAGNDEVTALLQDTQLPSLKSREWLFRQDAPVHWPYTLSTARCVWRVAPVTVA